MLDVEEPDADRGCEQHDRGMNEDERLKADEPDLKLHARAMAALVVLVLAHARHPARRPPIASLFLNRKR